MLLYHIVVVQFIVVVAETLARRLVFSKFTIILKPVFQLKSFKIFSKLIGIRALNAFWNSAAASGNVCCCFSTPGNALSQFSKCFHAFLEVHGSIPSTLGAHFDINVKVEYPKPKRIVFLPSAILAQFWFLLVFENL